MNKSKVILFFTFTGHKIFWIMNNYTGTQKFHCENFGVIFISCVLMTSCFSFVQVNGESSKPITAYDELSRNDIHTMEVVIQSQKVFRFAFNSNLFGWQYGNLGSITRHLYS